MGYWVIDIAASVAHAARLYREKPGVKVTYDAFHYVNLITGHMLQLTNPDASRSYVAIYLHENRLYVLDATVETTNLNGKAWLNEVGEIVSHAERVIERFTPIDGNTIRYQSLYYNRFPERQLGGRGGRGAPPQGGQPEGGQQGRP